METALEREITQCTSEISKPSINIEYPHWLRAFQISTYKRGKQLEQYKEKIPANALLLVSCWK